MNRNTCKKVMLSSLGDINLSWCSCGYYQVNVGSVTLHLEPGPIKALEKVMRKGVQTMEKAVDEAQIVTLIQRPPRKTATKTFQ